MRYRSAVFISVVMVTTFSIVPVSSGFATENSASPPVAVLQFPIPSFAQQGAIVDVYDLPANGVGNLGQSEDMTQILSQSISGETASIPITTALLSLIPSSEMSNSQLPNVIVEILADGQESVAIVPLGPSSVSVASSARQSRGYLISRGSGGSRFVKVTTFSRPQRAASSTRAHYPVGCGNSTVIATYPGQPMVIGELHTANSPNQGTFTYHYQADTTATTGISVDGTAYQANGSATVSNMFGQGQGGGWAPTGLGVHEYVYTGVTYQLLAVLCLGNVLVPYQVAGNVTPKSGSPYSDAPGNPYGSCTADPYSSEPLVKNAFYSTQTESAKTYSAGINILGVDLSSVTGYTTTEGISIQNTGGTSLVCGNNYLGTESILYNDMH